MILELSKDWEQKPLENLLDFYIGGDWGKDESFIDEGYELTYCIRGSEIRNWQNDKGSTASLRKIKKQNIQKRKLVLGDILVEISGGGPDQPVGRTVVVDKTVLNFQPSIPKICTNFLRMIRPKSLIDPTFLNFFLTLFYSSGEIVKYQGGSNNLRNLKFPEFLKILIPYPADLTSQRAVVARIEELFSELDKGIENLKIAQEQLKVYRQSVLKWAFEGRLTNDNLGKGELPEGWVNTKLGEDCVFSQGIQMDVTLQFLELKTDYVRFLRIIDFTQGEDPPRYIKDPGEKYHVSKEDVSLVRYGASTGFVCTGKEGVIANNLFQVKPKVGLTKKTLYYFLVSPKFQEVVSQNIKGAARPAISFGLINDVPLTYPKSNSQQLQLVQEIESRLSVADKMEETIKQSLLQAESLRQSILKKAFEGTLI